MMAMRPKVALVGASGYGNHYADMLLHRVDPESYILEGVIDPYAAKAPLYTEILARGIPIYDTLEQFYEKHTADLVLLVTPIRFHKSQAITAMEHGSNVLCEKPLMTNIDEVEELRQVVARTGRQMAVGFQWSFSPSLLQIKRDILNGVFGKPVLFQNLTVFPRYDRYFNRNNWAGKVFDPSGALVLDSVATNATAHYLHNIFFMLGDSISTSAMPTSVKASLYRVNPIETFDSCFMSGVFESGCRFQYLTTHCAVEDIQPVLRYTFENAVLTYDSNVPNSGITVTFKDGRVMQYDSPSRNTLSYDEKLKFMIDNVTENKPIPCGIDAVMPHMKVCDALFDTVEINAFPAELIYRAPDPMAPQGSQAGGNFVKGLYQDMMRCMQENLLPDELGLPWAKPSTVIQLGEYQHFSGAKVGYHAKG